MGYKMVYIKETRMFKAEKEGGIHATLRGVKEKGESFGVLPSGSPTLYSLGDYSSFSILYNRYLFI